jgi:DNA polymerase kappa
VLLMRSMRFDGELNKSRRDWLAVPVSFNGCYLIRRELLGIAANSMLAKICSNHNKPNGQFILESDREKILEFMRALPVRKIPGSFSKWCFNYSLGIGPTSEFLLIGLGIKDCTDIWQNRGSLFHLFTKRQSQFFVRVSVGISSGEIDDGTGENRGKYEQSS